MPWYSLHDARLAMEECVLEDVHSDGHVVRAGTRRTDAGTDELSDQGAGDVLWGTPLFSTCVGTRGTTRDVPPLHVSPHDLVDMCSVRLRCDGPGWLRGLRGSWHRSIHAPTGLGVDDGDHTPVADR